LEEKPSSSKTSVETMLVGKSIKDLAEIAQMVAQMCAKVVSGQNNSLVSSKGSSSAKPFTPVSFPKKWYQDAQDPYEDYDLADD
jgi:hypothetical protein